MIRSSTSTYTALLTHELKLMRKLIYQLLIALFCVSLAGCDQDAMIQSFVSKEDQALASNYFALLKNRQFDDLNKAIEPSLRNPALNDTLSQMADLIPAEEPTRIKLIGAQQNNSSDQSTINLSYEYAYANQWLVLQIALQQRDKQTHIVGLKLIPQATSIDGQFKFSLAGKSIAHYLILALAIIAPILVLTALIICIRMKLRGRKWPWVIFILLGIGQLSINWSSGDLSFAVLAMQLFSASAFAAPYGPWIITVSLPLGALCFLAFRKNHAAEPIANTVVMQTSENASNANKTE